MVVFRGQKFRLVDGIIAVALLAVIAGCIVFLGRGTVMRVYEEFAIRLDPSPARAYAYGTRYFDSMSPVGYDIERASKFFRESERLDPSFPGTKHQLARIAFLRGQYPQALAYINEDMRLHPKENPNAYYVRALIYGYRGEYLKAAADYEEYFKLAPANWAAINDYAWVLLKADLPEGAHDALSWGLDIWPENAWLLNNQATALYELGRVNEAKAVAEKATVAVAKLTLEDWLNAYPGNDPKSASQGLVSFQDASADNLEKIQKSMQ